MKQFSKFCPNITLYIYFINLQYFNLHKNSALYKLLWILLIWILSSTRPFLTLSDRRFWLGRANPDGGRKDCRHVDHGQDVTGIQDANVERRCQEVHKLDHGKGQFDSKSVRWKSFLFWQHRSPKSYKVRADLSWVLYHLCNFHWKGTEFWAKNTHFWSFSNELGQYFLELQNPWVRPVSAIKKAWRP